MPNVTVTTSKTTVVSQPQGLKTYLVQNLGPGTVYIEATASDAITPAANYSPSIAANGSVYVDVYQATLYAVATANSTVVYT